MRITNVKEAEMKVVSGGEPDFEKSKGLSIASALNWYAYYRDPKDSKKYLLSYMDKNKYPKDDIAKINKVHHNWFSNVGFVCRLIERGATLEPKNIQWIKDRIQTLISHVDEPEEDLEDTKSNKVTVQDRVEDQVQSMIGELEGFTDDYLKPINPYEWMSLNGVKSIHARKIAAHFSKKINEPTNVIAGLAEDDIVEGYSCYSKVELRKYVAFINSIISDANRIINNAKVIKAPRKTKKPNIDKLVSKLPYKKEDALFKIVSVKPTEIIGAMQLWVFNTKTRKLGVYFAENANGFTIKGSSIYGFIPVKSCAKTLRKPDDILQTLSKSNERKYKTTFDTIKSVEQELTGRLNSDTILLKVFK